MKPLKPTNSLDQETHLDAFEKAIQSKLYDLETAAPDFDFGTLSIESNEVVTPVAKKVVAFEGTPRRILTGSWLWMARAASVVMLLGIGGWTSFNLLNNELPENTTLAKVAPNGDDDKDLAFTQAQSSNNKAETTKENVISSLLGTTSTNGLGISGFVSGNTTKAKTVSTKSQVSGNQVLAANLSANPANAIFQGDSANSNQSLLAEETNQGDPQIIRLSAGFMRESSGKERSSRELRKAAKQSNGEAQAALVANSGSNIDLRNPVNTSARLVREALTQRGVVTTEQYGNRKAVTVRIGGNVVRVAR
jgi:hypothetical protein